MSEQNKMPDIQSREEFPDLKASKGKRHVQQRISNSRREKQRLGIKNNPLPGPLHKNEMTEIPEQHNENLVFTYKQEGNILKFHFITDKRVRCPTCTNEYKNILCHLQKSSCQTSNLDDLIEKLQQFKEDKLSQAKKDDQKKRKSRT